MARVDTIHPFLNPALFNAFVTVCNYLSFMHTYLYNSYPSFTSLQVPSGQDLCLVHRRYSISIHLVDDFFLP